MMKKQFWVLPIFLILAVFLAGCSLGNNHVKEIALPISLDEWPTPVPTQAPVSPTPFPKLNVDPTATPTTLSAATVTSTSMAGEVEMEAAPNTVDTNALVEQISAALTEGLSPVAVAITADDVSVRQGPGAGYGAAGTLERSSVVGVLGTNPARDWLFVANTALLYGWLPTGSLRITGSVENAPVLPADPVAAFFSQMASSSAGTSEGSIAGPQAVTLADLEPVATARVNNDMLNLRQRPGATFNLLDTLSRDDEVTVLALNKDRLWGLVETADGRSGWVSVEFLEADGDLANAPQVLSLTPPDDYPPDQVAPIAMTSGQPVSSKAAPASSTTSTNSEVSPVTAAAVANNSTVPLRVLAPVAKGRINQKVDYQRGPDASSGALGALHVDEIVSALAVNEKSDWVVVQADRSRVGWIPVDSLTIDEGSLINAYPVISAWVQSNEIDVLSGPGIFHETIGALAINDLVAVLARNEGGNWLLVETLTGGRGWTTPKLLTIMGSLADVPLVNTLTFEAPPTEPTPVPSAPNWPAQNLMVLQLSSGGDIMLINADGSNLRRLTHGIDPVLSPDGQSVAFTRWQGDRGSLWTTNVDGTNERVIIGDLRKTKGPDWSPDGSRIVFNYQHGGRLDPKERCFNLLKGKPPLPPMNAYDFRQKRKDSVPYLCWTLPPDPHWGLRVVDLADGRSEDVDGGRYAFRPTWDPGQEWRIVSDSGQGLLGIDVNRPDYREALTENVNDGSPVFSPDGRYLAVTVGNQGGSSGYDIFRMNADGSGRVRLTNTPLWVPVGPEEQKQWNNVAPAWSPDGSQIAFLTDRTGRWEIWMMNADGSGQHPMFSEEVNDQLDIAYNFVDERVLSWR